MAKIVGDSGEGWEVTVRPDGQEASFSFRSAVGRPSRGGKRSDGGRTLREHSSYSRELRSSSLEIGFTTTIEFVSGSDDWDPREMVASGFRTPEQREDYLNELRASSGEEGNAFEGVEDITLVVDGEAVAEGAPRGAAPMMAGVDDGEEIDVVGTILMYAVVGSVAALCLLLSSAWCVLRRGNGKVSLRKHPESRSIRSESDVPSDPDEEEAGVFHSILAIAPPGKLGLVIANPRRGMPLVLRRKEGSVLGDAVRAGDLLLSVDEVDCRGMTAAEVSELVGGRSARPERTLVLLREM